MPRWTLFIVVSALLVIMAWGRIDLYINPPPEYKGLNTEGTILYSTSWCGYCKRTREILVDKGVEFYEYDIERSAEGHRQYKELGGKGVPLLLINGEVVKGYNPIRVSYLVSGL